MAIISISRGFFSKGGEIAEEVAQRLGYRCIAHDVIADASRRFEIPRTKLEDALHDAPLILERLSSERQKYIAYIAAEVFARFKDDNVVYHGLAGYLFAKDITHVLKVRIMSDLEDRIALLMAREKDMSRAQATAFLKKEDRMRRSWSRQICGMDNLDPSIYDLLIHLGKLTVDDAVDLICETTLKQQFTTTAASRQIVEDLSLAANIRADLLNDFPGCQVHAEGSDVEVYARFTLHSDTLIADRITARVRQMPGVSKVSVILVPGVLFT